MKNTNKEQEAWQEEYLKSGKTFEQFHSYLDEQRRDTPIFSDEDEIKHFIASIPAKLTLSTIENQAAFDVAYSHIAKGIQILKLKTNI